MTGRQERIWRAVQQLEQFWTNYTLLDGYLDKTDAEIIDASHRALQVALYPNEFGSCPAIASERFKALLKAHLELQEQSALMDENDRLREEVAMLSTQLRQARQVVGTD